MEKTEMAATLYFSKDRDGRFGEGVLKVAYAGENRRGDLIPKETFERSAPSAYNCPVVCNYIREQDMIGGHDMEKVVDAEGRTAFVNITQPVGVVPEGAKWWWETEDEREYFCLPVLLWKRQEAYAKIKRMGRVDHSMEIVLTDWEDQDGVTVVKEFTFTAFCLLERDEPCYEGAELVVYSDKAREQFKSEYSAMLAEFKKDFAGAGRYTLEEGGKAELAQTLTFQNLLPQLEHLADGQTVETAYGTMHRYCILDVDAANQVVYCLDWTDGFPYAFSYELDGDKVVETLFADEAARKRVKYAFVDFEEGDSAQAVDLSAQYSVVEAATETRVREECGQELGAAKQELEETRQSFSQQVDELTQRAEAAEGELRGRQIEELLARFSDLSPETVQSIRDGAQGASLEEIEEKCFAARGRAVKFSLEPQPAPKLPTSGGGDPEPAEDEPYGGVVERYRK